MHWLLHSWTLHKYCNMKWQIVSPHIKYNTSQMDRYITSARGTVQALQHNLPFKIPSQELASNNHPPGGKGICVKVETIKKNPSKYRGFTVRCKPLISAPKDEYWTIDENYCFYFRTLTFSCVKQLRTLHLCWQITPFLSEQKYT